MLPPRPPSPPSGPPRGTYFSRRNETAPLPPSPAITSMTASSKNFTTQKGPWAAGERGQTARYRRRDDDPPRPFPMRSRADRQNRFLRLEPTARRNDSPATDRPAR